MKFFVSKYPIAIYEKDGLEYLPDGTIFIVTGINGNMFELKPASAKIKLTAPPMVDALMLERGFTAQDQIAT
jgi:hypothetical protein